MQFNRLHDPAQFARAIRSLAHDAHATLKQAPSRAALENLSVRIERLSSALGDQREKPVGLWLNHLESAVKSAARQRAKPVRTTCGCT